jgi:hypothetical protein
MKVHRSMKRASESYAPPWCIGLSALLLCGGVLGCGAADNVLDTREDAPEDVPINSSVNACPSFAFYMVLPRELRLGELATVTAYATDADSDDTKLSYAWLATSGSFAEPARGLTSYSCTDAGPQVLTVTTWDPDGCENSLDLDVTCAEP